MAPPLLLIFAAALAATTTDAAAPTFQSLMPPEAFPEPQFGMVVESAVQEGDCVRVTTTGAEVVCRPQGVIQFRQRIGHGRRVLALSLGRRMDGLRLTHSGPGFARMTVEQPRATLRINGDSLFLLHAHEPMTVRARSAIDTAWSASSGSNHLVVDELGGFGLYCSETNLDDRFDPYEDMVATYDLPADAVLAVGVCPPKPYDWERSLTSNVLWHWSPEVAYPPDEVLSSWRPHADVFLLQSAVMAWKDWNLDFVPRFDGREFARVREATRDLDARFMVYTSPYYFLTDTGLEEHAFNTFEDFKGWPCIGTPTGENIELFMAAITRVMQQHRPDGLYFDAQYFENPAGLYALARRSRELIGDDGLLEWHSTGALGPGLCYFPQADAYADIMLRGEAQTALYSDFDYLRFFVSGYNINNCLGVLCNNMPGGEPTPELTRELLRANGRYHTISWWLEKPEIRSVLEQDYQPRLTPDLRRQVELGIDDRQRRLPARTTTRTNELDMLSEPPTWEDPAFALELDAMPEGESIISPRNGEALSVADGALHVRALAHTYAFRRCPVTTRARGLVVKLRQGTDGGMSWGPSALLRWAGGVGIRLGTRSDGIVQIEALGALALKGKLEVSEWTWLRARWGPAWGVVEQSADGVSYESLWTFRHGGAFLDETAELLVGKVPHDGLPQDYTVPGEPGECDIDFVHVYGRPERR